MNDWQGSWGWGNWLAMILMMVAFWGLIGAVLVEVFRALGGRGGAGTSSADDSDEHAIRILDERFARGEMDADEYTQRHELLVRNLGAHR
jgi:putative membrane protein